MPYIFVHFREKTTVDGEQVYFSVSKDGYNFEMLNSGKPILTCDKGEGGCRDIELVRMQDGSFVIIATDLCIVNRIEKDGSLDWGKINRSGSKCFSVWRTKDLVNFSEQEIIHMGRDDFGCLWAPEVYYEKDTDEFFIHWGSTVQESDYKHMSIYGCKTKDFKTFTKPEMFFDKTTEILDSHIIKIDDKYHLFYKNAHNPSGNMHAVSDSLFGEYVNDDAFEAYMQTLDGPGSYEGPTTYKLPDGRWCLMLDFFGCEKEKMGFVPFVSEKVGSTEFKMAKEEFSFPYGFKHGGVREITDAEYERLKAAYPNN